MELLVSAAQPGRRCSVCMHAAELEIMPILRQHCQQGMRSSLHVRDACALNYVMCIRATQDCAGWGGARIGSCFASHDTAAFSPRLLSVWISILLLQSLYLGQGCPRFERFRCQVSTGCVRDAA